MNFVEMHSSSLCSLKSHSQQQRPLLADPVKAAEQAAAAAAAAALAAANAAAAAQKGQGTAGRQRGSLALDLLG
jgi:hypothetical protein